MRTVPPGEDFNTPERDTPGRDTPAPDGLGNGDIPADTIRLQLTVRELFL